MREEEGSKNTPISGSNCTIIDIPCYDCVNYESCHMGHKGQVGSGNCIGYESSNEIEINLNLPTHEAKTQKRTTILKQKLYDILLDDIDRLQSELKSYNNLDPYMRAKLKVELNELLMREQIMEGIDEKLKVRLMENLLKNTQTYMILEKLDKGDVISSGRVASILESKGFDKEKILKKKPEEIEGVKEGDA